MNLNETVLYAVPKERLINNEIYNDTKYLNRSWNRQIRDKGLRGSFL